MNFCLTMGGTGERGKSSDREKDPRRHLRSTKGATEFSNKAPQRVTTLREGSSVSATELS
jgi:hypothetical protein